MSFLIGLLIKLLGRLLNQLQQDISEDLNTILEGTSMKASKEFIENLESLTYDPQGFPRNNKELINIQVGTIRNLISILNFQHKVPYVNKEKVIRGQSITS